MVLAESKTISFDDFITWLPERSEYRYELRDGEILELPKQPTISVYCLVDGEYDLHQFRSSELIKSLTFPDLELSIDRMG
ncbi:hypothetical protein [Chamaesiphon sp. OTE_20_metabat_361]|uniref:hypothetical protein n=1 Tax=Chamaesiphon sp. OTE_20_metabat_361 TaxID=2964689 RepID=UPI00286C93CB|nr:hypothetical protein [Chamaesiphon sp. OTE_20_metabat_361]